MKNSEHNSLRSIIESLGNGNFHGNRFGVVSFMYLVFGLKLEEKLARSCFNLYVVSNFSIKIGAASLNLTI